MLHDPHTIPEPVLVISGLSYVFPAWLAFTQGDTYSTASNLFLLGTTVGFHATRQEWLFALDCVAILNFLNCCSLKSLTAPPDAQLMFVLSTIYCICSYFVGQQYKILSFDPDWNTQMGYHACMHMISSFSMFLLLKESQAVADVRRRE